MSCVFLFAIFPSTLMFCNRGTQVSGTWGMDWLTAGEMWLSNLSCVVDAKLTGVTGFCCWGVTVWCRLEVIIPGSEIPTGVGLQIGCSPGLWDSSRFIAYMWDTWVDGVAQVIGGVPPTGWNPVVGFTGVVTCWGILGVDDVNAVFSLYYISGWSNILSIEFTLSCANDVRYSKLFCSSVLWLGWHSG